MNPLVRALAWGLWSRHRVGFIFAAVIFVMLATTFPLLVAVTPAGAMAFTSVVPLVGIAAFVLNSLLLVEDAGSLTSRYPRHMLTFPVRTWALACWPMLFVSIGAGLLWVAAALLIYWPAGYQAPVLMPALALAGLMAWAQALAWMPLRVFWVRELATMICALILGGLGALPIGLMVTGLGSAGVAALILLIYIAAAFLVAWAAVASDRCGKTWRLWPSPPKRVGTAGRSPDSRVGRPFRSPFDAQLSYEWGCHGLMLNGFVSLILFVIWGTLLLRRGHSTPTWLALILAILAIVVVTTIASTGIAFGRFRPFWEHTRGFVRGNTFVSTRPMTTARLVAAKYRMAATSVILNWALAVAGTTAWLFSSDNFDNATILARDFFSSFPGWRGLAVIALSAILLPALSWRFLTGALPPVLTGRRWVADGAVWLYISLLAGLGGAGTWLARSEPDQLARLSSAIPALVATIAIVKGAAAIAGFRATLTRGLLTRRNVAAILSLWLVLTACGIALAVLVGPISGLPVSLPTLALSVAALVPLVRFPLATLALDWNRHG
jgi:hypothetical protein